MNFIDKIIAYQNYLPEEIKHALLIFRRTNLWRKKGIIFIHIPKAAGISINSTLYGRPMGHITAAQVRRYAPRLFDLYPTFAITRNPWDRCVSAYRFARKGRGQGDGITAGVFNMKQYEIAAFQDFNRFIEEWLVFQDLSQADYIFRPQLPFVADNNGQILVSHIGKVENMDSVQIYLSSVLGQRLDIGYKNRSGDTIAYQHWYNSRLIDLVGQLYAQDIKSFNYSFE